jgi:putative restriction endonuclease
VVDSSDAQLRQVAFDHVMRRAATGGGLLDGIDLRKGFEFGGERIPLINPQRGIFKPRQMAGLLSIRTVFPRQGGRVWYDDQREAHRQIYGGDETVEYAFMGTDPNSADNRWLREAMENQTPIIYFLGTSPGHYQPIIPTFIFGWHPESLRVELAFGSVVGASAEAAAPATPERRYALREVKARLPSGILPGRCSRRLRWTVRDLAPAGAAPTRCRAYNRRCARGVGTAHHLERTSADEDSPRSLRR